MFSRQERKEIFQSLFRGREDVFPRRWEKPDGKASGYAPVYANSRKDSYAPLTADWIEKHLIGTITLGVYPLLVDNTSWFIAADFDGKGWQKSVKKFIAICKRHGISIAVERSRSGNGAHAWCFFAEPYPAYKSRRMFSALLREADIFDEFEKNASFDRLFPNQDYHSGKGLGNLIALPLQGIPRKIGNSIFVNPEHNFMPFEDQWQFLHDVPRMTFGYLDERYAAIVGHEELRLAMAASYTFILTLSNAIAIPKQHLSPPLVSFLRESLNIFNIEYLVKERAGLSTYGMEKYIKTIQSEEERIIIPRGFLAKLCAWLAENKVSYEIRDERATAKQVDFKTTYKLFGYQKTAVAAFSSVENGILVAPAGSGKTMMGLQIVADKRQPTIILTHRRQIYDQWLEQIEHGFDIPKNHVGQIGSLKKDAKPPVTVAMVQTLARMKDREDIASMFGTVIVDECHHMPARMFRDVVSRFKSKYLVGLTATPQRKYNDTPLIEAYLGPIVHSVSKEAAVRREMNDGEKNLKPERDHVIVLTTDVRAPFGIAARNFTLVAKVVSNDAHRNSMIAKNVALEAQSGHRCLVLTERKEHAEMLRAYLRREFEVVLFSGDLSARKRKLAKQRIASGRFQILIATGQILGEGTDIADLDVLFLAFPVSFHGKLAQYIGRIGRSGGPKKIYDFRDAQVPFLEKIWKKREAYYRKNNFVIEKSDNAIAAPSLSPPKDPKTGLLF